MNPPMLFRKTYTERIKAFINFLLGNPKMVILVPILVTFTISYSVLYDYTVKWLNFQLQWHFDNTLDCASAHTLAYQSSASNSLASSSTSPSDLISFIQSDLHILSNDLSKIDLDRENYTLIKLTISAEEPTHILSYTFLNRIRVFQDQILDRYPSNIVSIISPLSFWPNHFGKVETGIQDEVEGTEGDDDDHEVVGQHQRQHAFEKIPPLLSQRYTDTILRYINSKSTTQLDSFFLKDVSKTNNLINHARAVKLYLIAVGRFDGLLSTSSGFKWSGPDSDRVTIDAQSTTNAKTVGDFVRYMRREATKKTSYYFILSELLTHSIIVITSLIFFGYTVLCIMNQYKIRSKVGLLLGWCIEIIISCSSAIAIVSHWEGKPWTVLYEPSTYIARFSFIFLISLVSSNSMLNLITYLSGDNGFYEGENVLRIRLLKVFIGIDPLVNPSTGSGSSSSSSGGSNKSDTTSFALQCESMCPTLCTYVTRGFDSVKKVFMIPLTTRCLLVNLVVLKALKGASTSVVKLYYQGEIANYFCARVSYFISALMVAITVDQFLQLTYLVCIIVMDLKRFELTDLLSISSSKSTTQAAPSSLNASDDNMPYAEELFGVNFVSSALLKLSSPPSQRPPRSSFRHKLGQYLLNIKNPIPSCLRLGFNTCVQAGFLFATFLSWTISIPHQILNDKNMQILEEVEVVSSSHNIFYYLELISVLLIIVGIAGVTFKFTYSEIAQKMKSESEANLSNSSSLDSLFEFDYESKKFFKSIDLLSFGHKLDVLKIKTNSSSPFIVTIGLDHKIFIWSPLYKPDVPRPISIGSIMSTNGKEFWPINHVNISNDGNYIILINYKNGLVKCYERRQLKYIWEIQLPQEFLDHKIKILESFFRRRTVPGYLTRKIHQQKKAQKKLNNLGSSGSRRGSISSVASTASTMSSLNGNFQAPSVVMSDFMNGIKEDADADSPVESGGETRRNSNGNGLSSQLLTPKDDFIMVLECGKIVTIACSDGSIKIINIFQSTYACDVGDSVKVTSATKLATPRITDRIICHLNNFDIVVASLINNNFNIKKLSIRQGYYNKASQLVAPLMTATLSDNNDFKSISEKTPNGELRNGKYNFSRSFSPDLDHITDSLASSTFQFNKSVIVPVDFVGMIVRIRNLSAELIDIQSGMLLKTFSIGHFKPNSFRVSHSEPTHCKFCGCASIHSFSIMYQDFDSNTLIMHTFRIDEKKSKNNICLRVERDPREIRCLGFNAVTEHQYWFENIEKWELTDINVIVGIKRRGEVNIDSELVDECKTTSSNERNFSTFVQETGLSSLRSRSKENSCSVKSSSSSSKKDKVTLDDIWEGFIITANDGKLMNYSIPSEYTSQLALSISKPLCIEKFGYKSVVMSFGNLMKVMYLGSDKLIEKDLYYSGTNTGLGSVLPNSPMNVGGVNNGLLFINKRRMHRERGIRR